MKMQVALAGVAMALTATWLAAAPPRSTASIQVALDKTVDLEVADSPIPDVFQRLTEATGVRFLIGEDVYDCLPYGEQTRLAVKLPKVTLRKALSPMLYPMAMEWTIERDAVRILPAPALLRMNRRATYEELKTLGKMLSVRLQATEKEGGVLEQLRKVAENKELNLVFHVKGERDEAMARAERALPGSAAAWLDALCHGQGWTWYLWGDSILILDRKVQVGRQLQRQVSLRYEGASLVSVLLDLAQKARITLLMDPGVMEYVPAGTRDNFSLMMTNATIAQALEIISGATGLKFITQPDGIQVEASDRLKQRTGEAEAARPRSPFYIRRTLTLPDGSTMEMLIRAEELPEDLAAALKAERSTFIQLLQRHYAATRPAATQPVPPTP